MSEIIHESAFMYRVHNNEFECLEGMVKKFENERYIRYKFSVDDEKLYTVSENPCEIHCGNLWMIERDDDEAARLLYNHFRKEARKHELEHRRLTRIKRIIGKRLGISL